MVKLETDDLKFRLFVITYMEHHVLQETSVGNVLGQDEIDEQTALLHAWRAAGQKYVDKVEAGLEAAAKAMYRGMQNADVDPDDVDPDGYIEKLQYTRDGAEIIIVPAWYIYYQPVKAIVSAYRADTGQPPL